MQENYNILKMKKKIVFCSLHVLMPFNELYYCFNTITNTYCFVCSLITPITSKYEHENYFIVVEL